MHVIRNLSTMALAAALGTAGVGADVGYMPEPRPIRSDSWLQNTTRHKQAKRAKNRSRNRVARDSRKVSRHA